MADPVACFQPNPDILNLGVSQYISNRTSGIYWSVLGTDSLLCYSSPRCSDARQVDFFAKEFSWNRTRKPRSPANTGDLERRYNTGYQWDGLASCNCYPNRPGKTQSLLCVSGHKLALSAEHIVSILSVQSYVLCSYLHSDLTSGTHWQRTLLSVDNIPISQPWYYWQSSPSMWVWKQERSAVNQNAITHSKSSGSPIRWRRASPGSGNSGLLSSSSTSQWPLFIRCSWISSKNGSWGTSRIQHRARLFVGMEYSC